jgi:Cu/Ag efflux protein CusF
VKRLLCVSCLICLCLACGNKGTDRHFHLTGEVKSLDRTHHTASVDAAAIPDFMEAMTMEYPVKSADDFDRLRVGEHIDATVNVHSDNSYDLSDIHESEAKK